MLDLGFTQRWQFLLLNSLWSIPEKALQGAHYRCAYGSTISSARRNRVIPTVVRQHRVEGSGP
jgi:hypothetical protein